MASLTIHGTVCVVGSNILAHALVIHLFSDVHTLVTLAIVEVKSGSQVVETSVITDAVKHRIGEAQRTIECLQCYTPREMARPSFDSPSTLHPPDHRPPLVRHPSLTPPAPALPSPEVAGRGSAPRPRTRGPARLTPRDHAWVVYPRNNG
jgi:hypothetical protein